MTQVTRMRAVTPAVGQVRPDTNSQLGHSSAGDMTSTTTALSRDLIRVSNTRRRGQIMAAALTGTGVMAGRTRWMTQA